MNEPCPGLRTFTYMYMYVCACTCITHTHTHTHTHNRYPGTTFMDHVLRYHDDPNVKMIVVLGEVCWGRLHGGERDVCTYACAHACMHAHTHACTHEM